MHATMERPPPEKATPGSRPGADRTSQSRSSANDTRSGQQGASPGKVDARMYLVGQALGGFADYGPIKAAVMATAAADAALLLLQDAPASSLEGVRERLDVVLRRLQLEDLARQQERERERQRLHVAAI